MVKKEFETFLTGRRTEDKKYIYTLEAICNGYTHWSDIKKYVLIKLKYPIYDSQLDRFLTTLQDFGFITKHERVYAPADPIIKKAFTTTKL